MGDLGLYILMILFLLGILVLTIFIYRWIKNILRSFKRGKYIQGIITFIIPLVIACVIAFYISEIIEAILIGIAVFVTIGFMMSLKFPNYYYYDE